jgi:hypothetical protein
MLVIDGIQWQADFDVIRGGLEPVGREFKGPWHFDIPDDVAHQVEFLQSEADALFHRLYAGCVVVDREASFRALITGPDPMHFDTKVTKHPVITSFINVATTPRLYRVGPTFKQVCDQHSELMIRIWHEATKIRGHHDASYVLRKRTTRGMPPLGDEAAPFHEVALAPGTIWFMDAKTLAHTAIYGEGAVMVAWEVEGIVAPQQPKLFRKMLAAREQQN